MPNRLATINKKIVEVFQSVCQEKTHIFVYKIHTFHKFEVVENDDTRYADGDEIALINFGPVAVFSEAKLTTSSRKLLKKLTTSIF